MHEGKKRRGRERSQKERKEERNLQASLVVVSQPDTAESLKSSRSVLNPFPTKESVLQSWCNVLLRIFSKMSLSLPARAHFENLLMRMQGIQTAAHAASYSATRSALPSTSFDILRAKKGLKGMWSLLTGSFTLKNQEKFCFFLK